MRYGSLKYSRSDNLGDEIQSLAAEQYLPRIDGFVDRDVGLHLVSDETLIILNGWFKHGPSHWREGAARCWPPSEKVRPVFFGFHVAYPDLLSHECLAYYRQWQPIGCRDKGTLLLLQEQGVEAEFTRCLTLTFPRREAEPQNGKVYIVEGKERLPKDIIPKELARGAVHKNHYISSELNGKNELKRKMAVGLLEEYRSQARLVITNLLHCTMPCLAMGIPVVFMPPHDPDDAPYRLDPVRGLLPIYSPRDKVDWNPPAPDISNLAGEVQSMLRRRLQNATTVDTLSDS